MSPEKASTMKPHPRIRQTIKWTGAAVTVVLMVVWVGSGWIQASFPTSWGPVFILRGGCIRVFLSDPPGGWGDSLSLSVTTGDKFQFGYRRTEAGPNSRTYWTESSLPVWMVAMPVLLASALAWRLDILARRRAKQNLCSTCNYDRTGLPIGAACPECGSLPA